MTRVLQITYDASKTGGGIASHNRGIAALMSTNDDVDYTILTTTNPEDLERVSDENVLTYSSRNTVARILTGIKEVLFEHHHTGIDTVAVGSLNIDSLWACIFATIFDVKLVIYIHGSDLNKRHGVNSLQNVCLSILTMLQRSVVLRLADKIICNSTYVRDMVSKAEVSESRITIINPGIFIADYNNKAYPDKGFNHKGVTLYSLGRLVERKGFGKVIKAFERSEMLGSDDRYIISGAGPYRNHLEGIKSKLGVNEVHITGFVNKHKKIRLLLSADIFVMPSRSLVNGDVEGFGIVLAEACACGCVVVAGKNTGAVDLVVPKKNGLLVDGRYTQSIKRALNYTITHRDKFWSSKKIRSFALENFSWRGKGDRIADMYTEVANR